jgi:conjugal transfer ATP-binding protein TraC
MTLQRWGQRIANWLGDTPLAEEGTSRFHSVFDHMAQMYKLCDFLPYRSFDEKAGVFINEASMGFVLETPPLVGSNASMQKEMTNLFTQILPDESALQVILWADPHIGGILDEYVAAREGRSKALCTLAQRRGDYLKSLAFHSPLSPYHVRNVLVLFCLSMPGCANTRLQRDTLMGVRRQLETTLTMLGLPVYGWTPADLIRTVDRMLHLNPTDTSLSTLKYNPFETLASQLSHGEYALEVGSRGLRMRGSNPDKSIGIRTYSVCQYPTAWSLHAMGELIGDMERDQGQIPCSFMLHYGVYVPSQDRHRAQVMAKASYVERQAYSPLAKFLPHIKREADELAFVREKLGQGERIVHTHMGVTLLCPEAELDRAQQTLLNLFTAKEWKLEANTYTHLPLLMTQLPLMWGEEKVRALLHLKKLKTTLSTESANLLPLQGEWKGTQTKAMILGGRRGQLMTWCPFDNTGGNYNMCVVGRSGSGKSVFMQELMTSTLGLGGRVFVMDVGRSFERTCFLLEGQFIEFTPSATLCVNPFSHIPVDNPEVAEDALAMIQSILVLMAAPSQGVDDKGAAMLSQAMLETWAQYKNQTTVTLISQWLTAHKDAKARDLGQMLFPYTDKGTYGR